MQNPVTPSEQSEMRALARKGWSGYAIADLFGRTQSTVHPYIKGINPSKRVYPAARARNAVPNADPARDRRLLAAVRSVDPLLLSEVAARFGFPRVQAMMAAVRQVEADLRGTP